MVSRRGGRGSAMEFARAAVQVAMEEHIPLMAVLTGQEFGEEGVMFIEDACEKMCRPRALVLQELAQAAGHGPEQPPTEPSDSEYSHRPQTPLPKGHWRSYCTVMLYCQAQRGIPNSWDSKLSHRNSGAP